MQTTVTTKGQVTIPKQLRDRFGIRPGDRVEMAEENGRVVLRPVRTLRDLRGAVRPGGVGAADERRVAKAAVARRVMGEMDGEMGQKMAEEMEGEDAGTDRAAKARAGYGQGRPDCGGHSLKGAAPDQDEPTRAASQRNIPDQAAPEPRNPDQRVIDQDSPDQAVPEQDAPDQRDPGAS